MRVNEYAKCVDNCQTFSLCFWFYGFLIAADPFYVFICAVGYLVSWGTHLFINRGTCALLPAMCVQVLMHLFTFTLLFT